MKVLRNLATAVSELVEAVFQKTCRDVVEYRKITGIALTEVKERAMGNYRPVSLIPFPIKILE